MASITVYCGSAEPENKRMLEAARDLGRAVARAGATAVTGAGRTGLMGAFADAALAAGGFVRGIIPEFMVRRGWNHTGLSELKVVDSMHIRKLAMSEDATGVIALPGGIGTLEELAEIITWRQLGLFHGNIVIYNVDNYYAPLLSFFGKAIEEGFMKADHSALFAVAESAAEAVELALRPAVDLKLTPKF